MDGDKLDARLVIGGLWETAPVWATKHTGEAFRGSVVARIVADTGWRVCGDTPDTSYDVVGHDDAPTVWALELRLPGPRGLGLEGLLRGVRARVGIDSDGARTTVSGATWRAADRIAEACLSGDEARIVQASSYLAMVDGLAAKLGWPTGPGAPVWAWTRAGIDDTTWWKLSARASSTESWSHEFGCELTEPDAALEATWRKECAA